MLSKQKGRFNFMKKIHIFEVSVAFGLVVSMLFSIVGFGFDCADIRENVVRLHILANSDDPGDQQVKLLVRDALLNCGKELFSGSVTVDNAQEILEKQKDELIDVANKTLKENGYDYRSQIYLTEEYFTTRSYEDFTLPAGEYVAVKVILGEGQGKNWWCVMFPPLCLPAASDNKSIDVFIGEDGADVVQNYNEYEVRFKIVEIYEGIKNKIKNKIYKNNLSQG